MNAPTDNVLQHIAQSMTPQHWTLVLAVIVASLVVSLVICLVGVWREVRKGEADLQRELARSESRAKAGGHERL
jgi:hypothetical protein